MTRQGKQAMHIRIHMAVRRSGLAEEIVQESLTRRLVGESLTEADLAELRRIRRLLELGVNLPGIEVILQMRRRIQVLQAELAHWERIWREPDWMDVEDAWQRLLPWKADQDW